MQTSTSRPPRYRFGPFELDPAEGSLERSGTRVKLQDLPCRLLVMLVERPGEIVTRDEVRQRLWPENTFVEFDNSLGVAIRKVRDSLGDDAEAPRYVETVPRRGYRFLAPVTVQEEAVTSDAPQKTIGTPSQASESTNRPARYAVVAAVALLLCAGAFWFRSALSHSSATKEGVAQVRVRRSIAVLGFRDLTGRSEDAWLSAAFSEMLNAELAAGGEFRVVSGGDVAQAKSEIPLTDEGSLTKSTLQRLRVVPGADVVVLGSYAPQPGNGSNRIRLDVRLQDTAAGSTIAEESITGSDEDIFALASQAGARLREALGMSALSPQAAATTRAALPSSQQALRFYTEGRARSWSYDYLGARDRLLKAIAADPDYPWAHSALSEAWERLGYTDKALDEIRRARDLSEHLPQEERLLIEGQYQQTIADWPKATETYTSLYTLFPDSLTYGIRLANVQRRVDPAASLRTLAALRHLPPPAGEDPRIDLAESSAWIYQDLGKSRAAAERAITKGNAQGSHLLVARAYGVLCQQGVNGGASAADALGACENARQSYAAAGDRDNEARSLNDFAALYFEQGDLARAEATWREAAPKFLQVGDAEGTAAASNNLGDVFLLQGNLREAKKFLEQAIAEYQAIGDKDGVARILNDLGDVSRQQGNLEVAVTTYQQAKATAQEIDDKNVVGYILTGLGDALAARGDLAAARKSYEESLALRNQGGEKQNAAETQVALAKLSVEEGHSAEAEAVARKCRDQFHQAQQTDDELAAGVTLIQALLAESKYADAQTEVEGVQSLATKSQNSLLRLQFALVSAQVTLASEHPAASRRPLESVIQQARGSGFTGVELEARLALAQLTGKLGPSRQSHEQFLALEKEARAKGFGLIARKAGARVTQLQVGSA